jgi:nitroreductase
MTIDVELISDSFASWDSFAGHELLRFQGQFVALIRAEWDWLDRPDLGVRADHGRLLPWRLIVVEGDARARLRDVMAAALSRRNPLTSESSLARERENTLRAPVIVVVATRCDESSKIPLIEQILSAGCAAHSIMQAAFAQNLGAMWKTSEAAYDRQECARD